MSSFASDASSNCEAASIERSAEPTETSEAQSSTTQSRTRKRTTTAITTWEHTRKPQGSEPERASRKNELIYYCKYCSNPSYSTTVSITFRNHLHKKHHIHVDPEQLHIVKTTCSSLLKDSFAKAGKIGATKLEMREEEVLKNAVN
jgi:hypothetical protein